MAYTAGSQAAPRVTLVAATYLDCARGSFTEDSLLSFLEGFQSAMALEMGEIWALKPALQFEILNRLEGAPASGWPTLVSSLRRLGEADWKELFEATCLVHRTLTQDPAGVYARMDFESRDHYLQSIGSLAKRTTRSELEVAAEVVESRPVHPTGRGASVTSATTWWIAAFGSFATASSTARPCASASRT